MLYNEFSRKLENILCTMDNEDFLSIARNMGLNLASEVKEMSEFDDDFAYMSPTELFELYSDADCFDTGDYYYVNDGGVLTSYEDLTDLFDVDDMTTNIELTMHPYGNMAIRELIDEYTTIEEDDILDRILDAKANGQTVKLCIDDVEYSINFKGNA